MSEEDLYYTDTAGYGGGGGSIFPVSQFRGAARKYNNDNTMGIAAPRKFDYSKRPVIPTAKVAPAAAAATAAPKNQGYQKKEWKGQDNNNNNSKSTTATAAVEKESKPWEGANKKFNKRNNSFYDQAEVDKEEQQDDTNGETKVFKMADLDTQTRNYFERIRALLYDKNNVVDAEEQEIIIDNAIKESEKKALLMVCDRGCSVVMEDLFKKCQPAQVIKFFQALQYDFYDISVNPNGSRVLEAILAFGPPILNGSNTGDIEAFNENLFKLLDLLVERIQDVVKDKYASYVLSTVLLMLNGTVKEKKPTKYQPKTKFDEAPINIVYEVPEEYGTRLESALKSILEGLSEVLPKMIFSNANGLETLKAIFEVASKHRRIYRKFLDKILEPTSDDQDEIARYGEYMRHQLGSVLCESLLKTTPDRIFKRLFENMSGQLFVLSEDIYANHVVQALIDNVRDKEQMSALIAELSPEFKTLIVRGRGQIIQKLVEGCLRLDSQQKEILKSLATAILPSIQNDQKDIASYLLELQNHISRGQQYSICGSIILQKLFNFGPENNQYVVESFMKLSAEYLVGLATNNIGSKVLDGFLDSKIPMAKRMQLIQKFKGHFVTIGLDKYGSYVIEKMYKMCDLTLRNMMCEELAAEEKRLFERPCGRYVLLITHINVFKKQKESWATNQDKTDKKRKMFDDIINDPTPAAFNNSNQFFDANKSKKQQQQKKEVESEEEEEEKPKKKSSKKVKEEEESNKKKKSKKQEEEEEEEEKPKKKAKKAVVEDEIDAIFSSKSTSSKKSKK
eukprot:gene13663-16090_t